MIKPIRTYENENSKLNKLFSLQSNKLYSGYLDFETLYDIYIDIDNEDNIVKMQKDDNVFGNLIKLFKPNIKYKLDFEVNHLIKLDPNFDAEVIITVEGKSILLNKKNPTTTEIKGDYVEISTSSNAILYFYNSLSEIKSKTKYKNLFQYEIPKRDKNCFLEIKYIGERFNGDIHYLIDVGFEGYAPFYYKSFDFSTERCSSSRCPLYFPNNYNIVKTELVEGEKLFIYYYFETSEEMTSTVEDIKYYNSLKNDHNYHTFFVIPANIEGEEEKNLIIHTNNDKSISLQVHYCQNNIETKPTLTYLYMNFFTRTIEFEDSKIYKIKTFYDIYKLNFKSNNEFVFSYSINDKVEETIDRYTTWKDEREVISDLNIIKAEIDFNNNLAKVKFIPNYRKSSTNYFIIIGPKNDTFTLESFNNPCFVTKLITENSVGVKIYEITSIGEEE